MPTDVHGKRTAPPRIATIGVGYNGSHRSALALAVGRELAATHGARIRVLEVVCPSRPHYDPRTGAELGKRVDALLCQARQRLAALDGVDGCAVYGIAVDELAAFGEEVDLLVIGLGGHGASRSPRGASTSARGASTSEYLQRHARCPVLVVPRLRLTCADFGAPAGAGSSRSLRRARWCVR
jgi:nucleotide-binding universal stress UspA family protein